MYRRTARWDLAELVDQVRSVCEIDENGCWIWRRNGYDRDWYPDIMIKRRKQSVARWILEVTTGETGEVARHRCDRMPCCNPDHLLWGSQADNVADAFQRGRRARKRERLPQPQEPRSTESFARGEKHGLAKLNTESVREIRARHAQGVSIYRLARNYGVAKSTIKLVVTRTTWTHV